MGLGRDLRVLKEPGFYLAVIFVSGAGAAFFLLAGWAMTRV